MTGTEVDVETQAHQIAARGREALVQRMRTAYSDAAAAHADLISLDDEHIEALVQAASDRADGLQWRRALAAVAADELGVSPTEALSHPAVARAQSLVGAPSYEQSLAEMIARPVPPPAPATENGSATDASGDASGDASDTEPLPGPVVTETSAVSQVEPEPEPEPAPAPAPAPAPTGSGDTESSDELETVEADDTVLELLPEPDPIEYETEAYDVEASFAHEPVPPAPTNPFSARAAEPTDEPDDEIGSPPETAQYTAVPEVADADSAGQALETDQEETGPTDQDLPDQEEAGPTDQDQADVVIHAVHLGGVANLPTKREGLMVRLSADGLDIMQGPSDIIGRLVWDEIEALEVPNLRVRRRSKQLRARLIVRTPHGDASFEVPEVSGDDLRDRVAPLMALYGHH